MLLQSYEKLIIVFVSVLQTFIMRKKLNFLEMSLSIILTSVNDTRAFSLSRTEFPSSISFMYLIIIPMICTDNNSFSHVL